jgi:hypothetical protein
MFDITLLQMDLPPVVKDGTVYGVLLTLVSALMYLMYYILKQHKVQNKLIADSSERVIVAYKESAQKFQDTVIGNTAAFQELKTAVNSNTKSSDANVASNTALKDFITQNIINATQQHK